MSKSRPVLSNFIRNAFTVFTFAACFSASVVGATDCSNQVPLEPNAIWQDAGQAAGEASCFSVELEAVGALAVDLHSDLDASEARLELVTVDAPRRLHPASSQHYYGLMSPGRVHIRVLSVDRHQPLDPFRLQVRFASVDALGKGELDDELEAEPDPFTGGGQCAKGELDDELEAEPDPLWSPSVVTFAKGELDDELEAEPDPFTGGDLDWHGLDWRHVSKVSLCGAGTEDLADDLLCARRWTPACGDDLLRLAGELRSAWGGDQDVIRIELDGPSTVTVRARGEVELALRLDDARGQRLDRVSGNVDGVRLVRSLTAGTYFLRLAGQRGEGGPYELRIETERH